MIRPITLLNYNTIEVIVEKYYSQLRTMHNLFDSTFYVYKYFNMENQDFGI